MRFPCSQFGTPNRSITSQYRQIKDHQMIDISSAKIDRLVTHKVGNRSRDDGVLMSQQLGQIDPEVEPLILRHYVLPLAQETAISEFYHETDLGLNELRSYVTTIFDDTESFLEQSQNIARHLYAASSHAAITAGEMIAVLLSDVRSNGESVEAIALLRVETKASYLQVVEHSDAFDIEPRTGISLSRVQKGVLILAGDLQIRTIDNLGRSSKYWLEDFIKCTPLLTADSAAVSSARLIKSLLARTESDEDRTTMVRSIGSVISRRDNITLKDIQDVAGGMVGVEEAERILQSVERTSGLKVPHDMAINSMDVAQKSRRSMNRISLKSGITLILNDPQAIITKTNSTRQGNTSTVVIEIDHAGVI